MVDSALRRSAGAARNIRVAGAGQSKTYAFPLSLRVLRLAADDGTPQMAARAMGGEIIALEAIVHTSSGGKLKELQFNVISTDPFASIRRQGVDELMKGEGFAGQQRVQRTIQDPAELARLARDDPSARRTLSYFLRPTSAAPSERMQSWVSQAEKLAGD
jgi:hypothetical protein